MEKKTSKKKTVILSLPDLAHSRFYKTLRPIYAKKDFFEAGYNQSLHLHDFPQIWFCVSGYATHIVGNDSLQMQAGDVVTVPAGRPHAFRIHEDGEFFSLSIPLDIFLKSEAADEMQLSFFSLLPAFADEISEKLMTRSVSLSEKSFEKAKSIFSRLTISSESFTEDLKEANKLFSLKEFSLTEKERERASEVIEKKALPILRAYEYINENFSEKITTKQLLSVSLLCQTTFFSLFKKFFGMRAAYYMQRLRVSHAIFYLAHTSYDISAVSDFCGFNSPSHLVLCHKEQTGVLPKYIRYKLKEYFERNPESKMNIKF